MRKINYIASAGTGKTYQLVEEVYNNYILQGISIDKLFISTFTEKSAGELKNRIISKLKEELYKNNNTENIFDNIYKIQESYIGTIHSLFFRILKNYSDITFINTSTKVLQGYEFDVYFDKAFLEYITNSNDKIMETITFIQDKDKLKKSFKDFYQKRIRILDIKNINYENEIEKEKIDIFNLKQDVINSLNKFIYDYYKELIDLNEKKLFKQDLLKIKNLIELDRIIELSELKSKVNSKFPKLLADKNISQKAKDIKKNLDNKLSIVEDKLIEKIDYLRNKVLHLNYLIILNQFKIFSKILEDLKIKNDFIDNDDILIKFLELLKYNDEIKNDIQNKFKAIIIDEFQDTDNLQTEVFKILSEQSDLIVLGDPKQCIYEWRNANLNDYINFINQNDFEHKTLDTCYRSSSNLVSFYNYAFSSENSLLDNLDKKYKYEVKSNDKNDYKEDLQIIYSDDEESSILDKINQLIEEGYNYGDILILFRKNKKADKLINLFKNNSIPFISYLDSNFKDNIEIFSVLNLLKLIRYPFDQLNLLSVLKSPIFSYSDLDLYNLKDKLNIFEIKEFQNIKNIIDDIENYSIYDLLKILYDNFKILEKFSLYPDSLQKIENLKKLLKISSSFDRNNFQLIDFIDKLENSEEKVESIILEDKNFIKLMSIHKSKGLESKVVIIPYILDSNNIYNTNGFHTINNDFMVNIINTKSIVKSINFDDDSVKRKNLDAEKRLLYVALTRAKDRLIIFVNQKKYLELRNKDILQKEIYNFIEFIKNNNVNFKFKFEFKNSNIDKKNYWETLKNQSEDLENQLKLLESIEQKRLEDYKNSTNSKKMLSVSQLMKDNKKDYEIEDYEVTYFEKNEEEQNYASNLGTLVHKILENFSFQKNKDEAKKEILDLLSKYNNNNNINIKQEAEEILLNFLNSKYYEEISNSNILFKELPFTLKENDRYIEGIIDLVYENNNKIIIMDYKTNKIIDKEKLEDTYKIQKEYYTKAIKLIFEDTQNKEIDFRFCWLREKYY